MPTDENLMKRGCTVVSVCVCLSNFETTPHLFLSCQFAAKLWNWLGTLFENHFDCTTIETVFKSCKNSWSKHVHNLALAAITHVFHSIWMAQNGIRFNNAKISIHAAKMKVLTAIATSATTVVGYTDHSEASILQCLKVQPRLRNAPVISLVLWKAPLVFWLKVNTDRSVLSNPPSAACGGIFRNNLASFKDCFAQKLDTVSVTYAEIFAIILVV
ncbi:ribonuclease H [Trifolium pratense]|uniref:Ribonuclease H n=1 Tax=Trifolium pratense TaxID=57577 RepID=A0A2K3NL16_TRIPR|nr:ribonuclease H [Trifolium pratense]